MLSPHLNGFVRMVPVCISKNPQRRDRRIKFSNIHSSFNTAMNIVNFLNFSTSRTSELHGYFLNLGIIIHELQQCHRHDAVPILRYTCSISDKFGCSLTTDFKIETKAPARSLPKHPEATWNSNFICFVF